MAIETQCPHCHKGYRLRDELAGKRVTCGNADCRQAFVVSGKSAANGSAKVAKPAAKAAAPPVDAEALAAAALADDADAAKAVPEDQRQVHMTCAICDHKWDVPWAMQGKNVLCPDCRHRQKVPEQKQAKVDWRDPKAGRPSMAKVERLDDVVSAGDASMVSGETLRKHVIKEEIEPRPAWHYVAGAAGALAVVAVAAFAVLSLRQNSKEGARDDYMARALADLQDAKETALSPKQAPLFRAALQIAAGEFALRKDETAGLKEAITHFAKARQELESLAAGSPGRDVLFSELALAQASLGGTDEQIGRDVRARWTPPPAGSGKPRVKEAVFDVQKQLLQTLTAMRREDRPVARDVRFDTLRRLARDLARQGHPEVLSQSLVAQGFFPPEVPEAEAEVAVETLKVTGDLARARTAGEQLVQTVKGNPKPDPVPVTAQALWMIAEPPITTGQKFASEPPATGEITDPARQVYVTLALLRNKTDEALKLANRPGTPDSRARALAHVAEWSDDPAPAVQAAQQVVAEVAANPKGPTISDYALVRLARQAGRAKQPAEAFVKAIGNDDYQAWAKAEALQAELATTEGAPADEARAALPDSPRDYRVGHAWARMALARQAARVGQGQALELGLDRWGAGTFRPFGYAGLALGLQDKALR
jgi:hypothetical protein